MPDLTIVIVSYNTRADLERCLLSLKEAPPAISHEVIVADNGSLDGTVEVLQAKWPAVRAIAILTNVGFARANNFAIRQTTGELILLLNSDTVVPAGAIDELVRQIRTRPRAAIVGPRIVDGAGAAELSFGRMMGPFSELRQKWLARPERQGVVEQMTRTPQAVDWVSGACLLVRRDAAEAVGLLDERYFMYCEDVDFCAAIRQRGGEVYFAPSAHIVHLRGQSGASNPAAIRTIYARSHLAFYQKHHPAWAPLLGLYQAVKGKFSG